MDIISLFTTAVVLLKTIAIKTDKEMVLLSNYSDFCAEPRQLSSGPANNALLRLGHRHLDQGAGGHAVGMVVAVLLGKELHAASILLPDALGILCIAKIRPALVRTPAGVSNLESNGNH